MANNLSCFIRKIEYIRIEDGVTNQNLLFKTFSFFKVSKNSCRNTLYQIILNNPKCVYTVSDWNRMLKSNHTFFSFSIEYIYRQSFKYILLVNELMVSYLNISLNQQISVLTQNDTILRPVTYDLPTTII